MSWYPTRQNFYQSDDDTSGGAFAQDNMGHRDLAGQSIRNYELREQIGMGGFGAVYKAYQPNVSREVAIKVILPAFASQPDFVKRFEIEAQLVARLEHMNIVPLYDYWRDNEGAYLVMRWLKGGSLRSKLRGGELDVPFIARTIRQIAEALAVAHKQGVIHRDMKPDNILLDDMGNAYLSDFGIAIDQGKPLPGVREGVLVGTPYYMSPEQFRGEILTPLSDVYSLGLVLYEMLTGERPFGNVPIAELVQKQMREMLPSALLKRPDLPLAVDHVVMQATAKKLSDRYKDAVSLAIAFEEAVNQPSPLTRSTDTAAVIYGKLKATIYDRADVILEKPRRLIGRDDLIASVKALLTDGERVLLRGMGGMGKTSLAATIAAEWLETAKKGVIWLEAANENADTLFEALTRALGEQNAIVGKSGDERIESVRRLLADRGMLLVIDNVWNDRALFELMKAAPPTLPLLITSRHDIPIDGEIIDVNELSPEQALDLLKYHARKDYDETEARDLCKRLGYHPFTLEIAGKRMKVNRSMTPGQLIESIQDAPHRLTLPQNFAETGRQGVQDLLDASVDELLEESRTVFMWMGGLFAPVASAELLSLVTGLDLDPMINVLNDLDQRGLADVVPEVEGAPPHYRLHDLTYSYARAFFKDRQADRQMVIRALRTFVELNVDAFDNLEFDQVNILGGAKQAFSEGDSDTVVDMMTRLAVQGFMDTRGHTRSFLEQLDNAIVAARQLSSTTDTLHYLMGKRGNAYRDRGDYQNALNMYQEALSLAPNNTRKAILTSLVGTVRFLQEADDAEVYFDRAEQISRENHDDRALSVVLEHRGHHAKARGDYKTALRFFNEALQGAERLQDTHLLFFALLNVGALEYELNLPAQALVNHQRASQIAEESGNYLWIAATFQCMGEDYHSIGDRDKAHLHLSEALSRFRDFGATAKVNEILQFMDKHGYSTNLL